MLSATELKKLLKESATSTGLVITELSTIRETGLGAFTFPEDYKRKVHHRLINIPFLEVLLTSQAGRKKLPKRAKTSRSGMISTKGLAHPNFRWLVKKTPKTRTNRISSHNTDLRNLKNEIIHGSLNYLLPYGIS